MMKLLVLSSFAVTKHAPNRFLFDIDLWDGRDVVEGNAAPGDRRALFQHQRPRLSLRKAHARVLPDSIRRLQSVSSGRRRPEKARPPPQVSAPPGIDAEIFPRMDVQTLGMFDSGTSLLYQLLAKNFPGLRVASMCNDGGVWKHQGVK